MGENALHRIPAALSGHHFLSAIQETERPKQAGLRAARGVESFVQTRIVRSRARIQ
jgi:hypothetical protein